MTGRCSWGRLALILIVLAQFGTILGEVDSGVIRLRPDPVAEPESPTIDDPAGEEAFGGPRRGFDYGAFESRLESRWFQRKGLLADGRIEDSREQSREIQNFCREEGVRRLTGVAGALIAESSRYVRQGDYVGAVSSLSLAEALDPGRAQIHRARADVFWRSGQAPIGAVIEYALAVKAGLLQSVGDLRLLPRLTMAMSVALAICLVVFSGLMLLRYQIPFRHEVEEWADAWSSERWGVVIGWFIVLLPALSWVGAGWIALYWLVIFFRFMNRRERLATVVLLLATAAGVPIHRAAVAAYGMSADPEVRTTLSAAGGEYDPDRVRRLQQLVDRHPDDATYRFLLAGLYKSGRYFEEAYAEYRAAIDLQPSLNEAHINVGNIFHITGQYGEAVANYTRALEIDSDSILAYFNMHLSQSESFRFKEAEASLNRAGQIDSARLADMISTVSSRGERPSVMDATLKMAPVWTAALGGRQPRELMREPSNAGFSWLPRQLINPLSIVSVSVLLACGAMLFVGRDQSPARRCIRCGRPFCQYCKSGREGHEYCSQCLHLYVLGDGLAPETKTRKLFEVERHDRNSRNGRRLLSTFFPGAAHVVKGDPVRGALLLLGWWVLLIIAFPGALAPLEIWTGVQLRLDTASPAGVPLAYLVDAPAIVALFGMVMVWVAGNTWRWEGKGA